jgi:hypothetical protein
MILGFTKQFRVNGRVKNTNFVEKIKKGIKLHTIREDINCRWTESRPIHFATGVRTSQYKQFHSGICTGVQSIEIADRTVFISGKRIDNIEELAINDGFDSVEDFWGWFDQYTPFVGRLIHWSDLRY